MTSVSDPRPQLKKETKFKISFILVLPDLPNLPDLLDLTRLSFLPNLKMIELQTYKTSQDYIGICSLSVHFAFFTNFNKVTSDFPKLPDLRNLPNFPDPLDFTNPPEASLTTRTPRTSSRTSN